MSRYSNIHWTSWTSERGALVTEEGIVLHNILPRVLQQLADADRDSHQEQKVLDMFRQTDSWPARYWILDLVFCPIVLAI